MMLDGMDGLVGGDEDEVPHAELVGQFGHALRAADVVADRLADVGFHQRHVLVGGGVEDDFRTDSCVKSCRIRGSIGDVGDAGVAAWWRRAGRPELPLDVEDAVFAAAHQHSTAGLKRSDLPADFRADAAAGAGDHHRAALPAACRCSSCPTAPGRGARGR